MRRLRHLRRDRAREVALLRQADQLILRIDIRLLERGRSGLRLARSLEQSLRIVLLELRIRIDRRRAASQAAARIGELQVAGVDAFLLIDLAGVVVVEILAVLVDLRLAIRIAERVIDLADRLLDLLLLLLIGCIGRIRSVIPRTHANASLVKRSQRPRRWRNNRRVWLRDCTLKRDTI